MMLESLTCAKTTDAIKNGQRMCDATHKFLKSSALHSLGGCSAALVPPKGRNDPILLLSEAGVTSVPDALSSLVTAAEKCVKI